MNYKCLIFILFCPFSIIHSIVFITLEKWVSSSGKKAEIIKENNKKKTGTTLKLFSSSSAFLTSISKYQSKFYIKGISRHLYLFLSFSLFLHSFSFWASHRIIIVLNNFILAFLLVLRLPYNCFYRGCRQNKEKGKFIAISISWHFIVNKSFTSFGQSFFFQFLCCVDKFLWFATFFIWENIVEHYIKWIK